MERDALLRETLGLSHRTEARRNLPSGSTLLLCTGGFIERRDHDINASIAQLVALLAHHGECPLPERLRWISSRPVDPAPGDDVVVLAPRVPWRRYQ
ncbi:hypothetical protein ABZY68_33270 [Streptomyces sp. NPDC006482]|uniref:hypothetical protein n=1 Tax=Streptomyces sp. NPDC006482 TaxID=3154306 RepID=UPI0033B7163E